MSHDSMDDVPEALDALDAMEVREHPAVYERIHHTLRLRLEDQGQAQS